MEFHTREWVDWFLRLNVVGFTIGKNMPFTVTFNLLSVFGMLIRYQTILRSYILIFH